MASTYITEAVPISEYAIIVSPDDNVAVVKKETQPGLQVMLPDSQVIRVSATQSNRTTQNLCANLCAKLQWMFKCEDLLRKMVGAWGFEPQTPTVSR
jgi:hypothetical protein